MMGRNLLLPEPAYFRASKPAPRGALAYGRQGMIRNHNYLSYHETFFDRDSLKRGMKAID
jgi:hypothetical protein